LAPVDPLLERALGLADPLEVVVVVADLLGAVVVADP
jgi:hypothetical protein